MTEGVGKKLSRFLPNETILGFYGILPTLCKKTPGSKSNYNQNEIPLILGLETHAEEPIFC